MSDLTPRSLEDRIRDNYERLPPNERRLADMILNFPGELASYAASELADLANVSKATASRFFKRIGYESFDAARRDARAAQRWGSPFYRQTRQAETRGVSDTVRSHVETEAANIGLTFEQLSHDDLAAAIEALGQARRIYCLGFRTSAMVSSYAAWLLGHIRDDVLILPQGGNTLAEQIAGIGPDDVVFAVGLRRRLPIFGSLLRVTSERGARILLITDPTSHRSAALATWTFRAEARSPTLFDSDIAANSLVHLICGLLASRMGAKGRARMKDIEALHAQIGDFER